MGIDCLGNGCHGNQMAFYSDSNFHPDNAIGYLVRRIEQIGTAALESVYAAHDITKTQWSALVALHFNRATTCAEIARDLGHDKGATTRLVDTLEDRGWITRARGEEDRRIVHLALTPSGEAIAAEIRDEVIAIWNDWLADWPEAEVTTLIRLLAQLRDTLQHSPDESAPA